MRRREFITLLAGAAVAWPLTGRAQERERIRRIGALFTQPESNPQSQARNSAFVQGLQERGWTVGRNISIEYRWSWGNADLTRKHAAEFAASAVEVVVCAGSSSLGTMLQASRTIPIVFTIVPDPVGAGFVESLARPGGNATGFLSFEPGVSSKLLELLKEIAPGLSHVAVIRDPNITGGIGQWSALQTIAPSLRVELRPINVLTRSEIERAITDFAKMPNGGLIVTGSGLAVLHRDVVIALAAKHKLPAIYYEAFFARSGGLISYGPNYLDLYRQAAGYVDRILKGEKPADLPVQAPTKYELVINLKTVKGLGLEVPATLLARADEVIE
jgi:putative ABC transport system substrate-binding protein